MKQKLAFTNSGFNRTDPDGRTLPTFLREQRPNSGGRETARLKRRFFPLALASVCAVTNICAVYTVSASPAVTEAENLYGITAAAETGVEALQRSLFAACPSPKGIAVLPEGAGEQASAFQQGQQAPYGIQREPADPFATGPDLVSEGSVGPAAETQKPASKETGEDFSKAYRSGVYYRRLKEVVLTGNYRADIMAIAQSQLGYHEGDNEAELNGESRGNGDYTEYGRRYDQLGRAWCSEFASWCARQAGIPTSILGDSRSATARNFGGDYHPWSDTVYAGGSYEPLPGDLVLFVWGNKSPDVSMKDHTALFSSASWSGDRLTILTLDGNCGNMVQNSSNRVLDLDTGELSRGHIAGFVAPRYGDRGGVVQSPQVSVQPEEQLKRQEEGPELPKGSEQTDTEQPAEKPEEKPAEEKPGEQPEPVGEPEEDKAPEPSVGDVEEAVRLINSEREANGLGALELSNSLMEIAQYQASVQAGKADAPIQTLTRQLKGYGVLYSDKVTCGYANFQTLEGLMEVLKSSGDFVADTEDFDQIGVGSCWRDGYKQLHWYIIAVKAS